MGRKRISRGKAREPITISLPRDLIIQLDGSLSENHTRSRLIESLIKGHLSVSNNLHEYSRHSYECLDCGRGMSLARFVDPFLVVCRESRGGCGSSNIIHRGVMGEEE